MDDAVDAELAELQTTSDGVRAHWLRPALLPLEPSSTAVGALALSAPCCTAQR